MSGVAFNNVQGSNLPKKAAEAIKDQKSIVAKTFGFEVSNHPADINQAAKTLQAMRRTLKGEQFDQSEAKDILKSAKQLRRSYNAQHLSSGSKVVEGIKHLLGFETKKQKVENEFKLLKQALGKEVKTTPSKIPLDEQNRYRSWMQDPIEMKKHFDDLNAQVGTAYNKANAGELDTIKQKARQEYARFNAVKTSKWSDAADLITSGRTAKDSYDAQYAAFRKNLRNAEKELRGNQNALLNAADDIQITAKRAIGSAKTFIQGGIEVYEERGEDGALRYLKKEAKPVFSALKFMGVVGKEGDEESVLERKTTGTAQKTGDVMRSKYGEFKQNRDKEKEAEAKLQAERRNPRDINL